MSLARRGSGPAWGRGTVGAEPVVEGRGAECTAFASHRRSGIASTRARFALRLVPLDCLSLVSKNVSNCPRCWSPREHKPRGLRGFR